MKIVFSSFFKEELLKEETRYSSISARLGDDFHDRVKEAVRVVARWKGGGHIGPHGYPCRHCKPFPFLLYYQIENDVLYVLGIVHERRHPDHLRQQLDKSG